MPRQLRAQRASFKQILLCCQKCATVGGAFWRKPHVNDSCVGLVHNALSDSTIAAYHDDIRNILDVAESQLHVVNAIKAETQWTLQKAYLPTTGSQRGSLASWSHIADPLS
jgi:hypothetical protein